MSPPPSFAQIPEQHGRGPDGRMIEPWQVNGVQRRPAPLPDDQSILDVAGGLRELAASVRDFPGSIAREAQVTKIAFCSGAAVGSISGLVIGILIAAVIVRLTRR